MNTLALFLATFALVFGFGFLSRGGYLVAFVTTFLIGAAYLVLFRLLPMTGERDMWAYLLGGPLGIIASMWLQARMGRDAWEVAIVDYLQKHIEGPPDSVTIMELFERAIGIQPSSIADQRRVHAILRRYGWTKHRTRDHRIEYRPPDAAALYGAGVPWRT
jgi:Zn-dependent protease with chaperone function